MFASKTIQYFFCWSSVFHRELSRINFIWHWPRCLLTETFCFCCCYFSVIFCRAKQMYAFKYGQTHACIQKRNMYLHSGNISLGQHFFSSASHKMLRTKSRLKNSKQEQKNVELHNFENEAREKKIVKTKSYLSFLGFLHASFSATVYNCALWAMQNGE